MLVLDEGHRIVDANPPAWTFLGKSEDVVGSAAVEMLAGLAELLEVGQGQIKVVLLQSQRTCEVSLLALDRDRTRRDGYLVMLQDISERKNLEAEEAADQKIRERIWAMDTAEDIYTVVQMGCETLQILGFPFAFCSLNIIDNEQGRHRFLHILLLQRDRLYPPRRAMTSRSWLGSGGRRLRSIARTCITTTPITQETSSRKITVW